MRENICGKIYWIYLSYSDAPLVDLDSLVSSQQFDLWGETSEEVCEIGNDDLETIATLKEGVVIIHLKGAAREIPLETWVEIDKTTHFFTRSKPVADNVVAAANKAFEMGARRAARRIASFLRQDDSRFDKFPLFGYGNLIPREELAKFVQTADR